MPGLTMLHFGIELVSEVTGAVHNLTGKYTSSLFENLDAPAESATRIRRIRPEV